jgi:leucyl aminopeptidase
MKIAFAAPRLPASGVIVLLLPEGAALEGLAAEADRRSGGQLARALKAAKFAAKRDQQLEVLAAGPFDRVLVMGLGNPATLTPREAELLGGAIVGALQAAKVKQATVAAELVPETLGKGRFAALLASGAKLRAYSFLGYKSKKSDSGNGLDQLTLLAGRQAEVRAAFAPLEALAEGVHFARDLVNEPPNHLHPETFAKRLQGLSRYGLKLEVLTPAQMKKLGMGALLGVAQGSAREARLVIMRWNGGKSGDKPLAFVGKGVTFDTGGISIKPAAGMEDMKGDMAGAACVAGLMMTLARRKAKVNAIGAVGLVENMPDGEAQRPGDVVTSMSGQTIAVLNTDAEGRLVLADALWYVQHRFKPQFMIDLATLTGAILVALGKEHAGLFSNNDQLAEHLAACGLDTGEKVWRLPLSPDYDKLIDHDVADMKNTGGRLAGSITAAQFLQRFVNGVPWVHLDVAGTAMDATRTAINPSWGPGWGVRLLDRLVSAYYEKR